MNVGTLTVRFRIKVGLLDIIKFRLLGINSAEIVEKIKKGLDQPEVEASDE